jgi:hypothetical protein
MHSRKDILGYAILGLVALAGAIGAPWWFALIGAGGLATEDSARLWHLRRCAPAPPSTKQATYVVTGLIANLLIAGVSYWLGAMAGALWLNV